MRIDQLRAFEAVSRLGHFTRAAESLYLAQPSLSRQITSLEAELGATLFHRLPGRVDLTPAGDILLPVARRILADDEAVRRELADLAGLTRGRVRLGATPSLSVGLVAEALATFRRRYPGIDLQITERGSRELSAALAEGALDLALVVGPSDESTIEGAPLLSEELVAAASAENPPPGFASTLTFAALAELPLVAFHESYDLKASTDAAFAAAGARPSIAVGGAEMDAVLRFVERGIGVAVVPAMVLVDRPALRASRLLNPTPSRVVNLAQRSGVTPGRATAAMSAVIRETAALVAAPGTPLAEFASIAPASQAR